MEKWIYIVESNCKDPSREDEYIKWYQDSHLPNLLSAPGFVAASFFTNTNPDEGEGKFMAVYRIESDDIDKTMALRLQRGPQQQAAGRTSDLLEVVSRSLYREV